MRKRPYYEEIYTHIIRQFYTGEICLGDTLPSMDALCTQYAASPNTIRTVMRKLSNEGYISTRRGKATRVVSITGDRSQAFAKLRSGRETFADTFDLMRILLPSMAVHSVRQFSSTDFQNIFQHLDLLAKAASGESFRQNQSIMIQMLLSKVDNPLFLSTVRQAEEIVIAPRMLLEITDNCRDRLQVERKKFAAAMRMALLDGQKGQFVSMNRQIFQAYSYSRELILSVIDEADHLVEKPAPMDGNAYLYEPIVSDIIGCFYDGTYGPGDMLPSEGAMCQRYGVSMPTVKKAYKILSELEITRTVNGKGTQVTLFTEISEHAPSLNRLTRLSAFLEILEMLSVTIKDTALYAARRMRVTDMNAIEELLRALWAKKQDKQVHSLPLLVFSLVKATGCRSLGVLCQEIKKYLIWSIYLDRFLPNAMAEQEQRHYLCLSALTELRRGDAARFSAILEKATIDCLDKYRQCFDQQIHLLPT